MPPVTVTAARKFGVALLAQAEVPSPVADVQTLLAEVLCVKPSQLPLIDLLTPAQWTLFCNFLERRRQREPLQHILGVAYFRYLTLEVGPGVFVPRPETEVVVTAALAHIHAGDIVVDLCAGSGAIGLAIATECPQVQVIAVEASPAAFSFLARNAATLQTDIAHVGSSFRAILADATDPGLLPDLAGHVSVVVANPPYIPQAAVPRDPEVAKFDPEMALYGGHDGMSVIRPMLTQVAKLLKPKGRVFIEHGDTQGNADGVPCELDNAQAFIEIEDKDDLTGRSRFTQAVRR